MAEVQLINMDAAIKGWAEVTVDRFHEALDKYNIGTLDGELWKSIAYELKRNGGNIEAVVLKFKQHGRFVDMRVGKGHPIHIVNEIRNSRYGRKKKPWYSKTKTREIAILRSLLVREYGVQTVAIVEGAISTTETVNI